MPVNVPTAYEGKSIGSMLCRVVRDFFQDESHRQDFAKWYEQRYGRPYTPKPKEVHKNGKRT